MSVLEQEHLCTLLLDTKNRVTGPRGRSMSDR